MIVVVISLTGINNLFADEGLWLPTMLKKYKIEDMQKAGFKLTAEDIYDVNKACLKDAIVGLSKGNSETSFFCSGSIISEKGLLLTNHHCGLSYIEKLSTLEHNYLKNGYWAKNTKEELYCRGLNAAILVKVVDVTDELLKGTDKMEASKKRRTINNRGKAIVDRFVNGTTSKGKINSCFAGSQYILSIYKIFKDVRLVGTPTESIGKFGKDTDNWTWPRHTGDFTLFRIYSSGDNEPVKFAQNNKPYAPKNFLKISTKGVKEGDFTMVLGYPGTTKQYITSFAIQQMQEELPLRVKIRTQRLKYINAAMKADPAIKLKYTAKAASIANAWKKWQGELEGIEKFDIVGKKVAFEKKFIEWYKADPERKKKYGDVLFVMKQYYRNYNELNAAATLFEEVTYNGVEAVRYAAMFDKLSGISKREKTKQKTIDTEIRRLKHEAEKLFNNWDYEVDRKIYADLLKIWTESVSEKYWPNELKEVVKKYKGDFDAYALKTFSKSMFTDKAKVIEFLDSYKRSDAKKIDKDPLFSMAIDMFMLNVQKIYNKRSKLRSQVGAYHSLFVKGVKAMSKEGTIYPDANSTFRVSYGNVKGYMEKDCVYHTCTTTFDGLMDKAKQGNHDYVLPEKLNEIYKTKDYGKHAVNGSVPVCFIANNHTTGGNSGSPVINAEGELIGINFDRAWKGVFSDYYYTPKICRNISLDIRFVLFIIDKYAGAENIIDELNIIK